MTTDKYILDDDGEPQMEFSLLRWAEWFESHTADRLVLMDRVSGDVKVSTVFLGLDHNFGLDGQLPVLWETMIFGGAHDGYQERYTRKSDAIKGHLYALRLATASLKSI